MKHINPFYQPKNAPDKPMIFVLIAIVRLEDELGSNIKLDTRVNNNFFVWCSVVAGKNSNNDPLKK